MFNILEYCDTLAATSNFDTAVEFILQCVEDDPYPVYEISRYSIVVYPNLDIEDSEEETYNFHRGKILKNKKDFEYHGQAYTEWFQRMKSDKLYIIRTDIVVMTTDLQTALESIFKNIGQLTYNMNNELEYGFYNSFQERLKNFSGSFPILEVWKLSTDSVETQPIQIYTMKSDFKFYNGETEVNELHSVYSKWRRNVEMK